MILNGSSEKTDPEIYNGKRFHLPTTTRMVSLLLSVFAIGLLLISKIYFNQYIIFLIILLGYIFFFYKNVIIGKKLVRISFLFYVIWLLTGLSNTAVHIDFKYHLAWILSFLVFVNLLEKMPSSELFKYLFRLNVFLFAVYILLLARIIPNVYVVGDPPEYQAYRLIGPVVISFYAICMVANYPQLEHFPGRNYYLFLNFGMGVVVAILLGSLQHFAIFVLIYLVTFFRQRHLLHFVSVFFIGLSLFAGTILLFGSDQHHDKFMQLVNPLQSPTMLTRINDLYYMLEKQSSVGQALFGDGPGVTSEVFRVSTMGNNLFEFREFLEIDNGFYYVYHRAGLVGLGIFLFFHGFLLKNYGNVKNRMCFLAFFLITNALSIHYFTNPISSLMLYLMLRLNEDGNNQW